MGEEQLGPNEDYARAAPPLEGQLAQVYMEIAPDLHKWTRFSIGYWSFEVAMARITARLFSFFSLNLF